MSTRSGEFVTLRDLRREVGNDAARLFYVMRSNDQHLDFDLELATSRSNDNPVYYIQYANARVSERVAPAQGARPRTRCRRRHRQFGARYGAAGTGS
jgi:arginyl-tRNA synthetase